MNLPLMAGTVGRRNLVVCLGDISRLFRVVTFGLSALVGSLAAGVSAHAATTFGYNFGTASPGTAAPTSGSSANVTAGSFSDGNTNGTVTALSTTSASSGYTGASGSYNLGNAATTGALTLATSAYYAVTLTPAAGDAISLTGLNFGGRSTSTGPTTYALYSSLNNYSTAIFSDAVPNDSNWNLYTNSFSYTGTTGTAITFRLYTFGGSGSANAGTINSRIDDVAITADGIAVPEPATCLAGALVVGAVGWSQRHRLGRLVGLMGANGAA